MKRRDFVLTSAAILALPGAASAQRKTPVIGLLWNDSLKPSPFVTTLMDALRKLGHVEGKTIIIEQRSAEGKYDRLPGLAAELVHAKVDLIVAYGSSSVFAAAKATQQIPIVMHIGVDPVASGLVGSLSRPGGNLTGIATLATGLNAKRIELLKEMNPRLASVGVLLAPNVGNPVYVRDSEAAARALGLQVHFAEVRIPGDLDSAIARLAAARVGAIYVTPSTLLLSHSGRLAQTVANHRLAAIYSSERYVDAGGLMIYGASAKKAFVRAAGYVDRILKGARPGELPIEQVTDVELIINLGTARALGIKIPQSILVRADRVIE